MARKTKGDKRRQRAKAKAKARAGSPIPANKPGYRNPEKAMARIRSDAIAASRRQALAETAARASTRECGTCSECCTVLGISTLEKPAWSKCEHVCDGGGCGIYAERPDECADYLCFWRQGYGADEDRPDSLGVVFDLDASPAFWQIGTGKIAQRDEMVIMARASDPAAFEDPRVKAHTTKLVSSDVVCVFVHGRDGVTVWGPKYPEGLYLERATMEERNAALAAKTGTAPRSVYWDEPTVVHVPDDLEIVE